MPNHASTDEIVQAAWNASKTYWKEFVLLPIIVSVAFFLLLGLLSATILSYSSGFSGIVLLLAIAAGIFAVSYYGAQVKWCEEIHNGAKTIDIQDGLKFGLSRFWGLVGTALLTGIKTFLWMLLLILPGYYKGIMYSKSTRVSILDGISGGDANRISEAIVKKAGPIRTFSNLMGVTTLGVVAMYLLIALALLFAGFFGVMNEYAGLIVGGVLGGGAYAFAITVITVYFHFEYLYYRDEAKAEVAALKKVLS